MTGKLNWTAAGDAALLRLRAQGVSWDAAAGVLGVSRNAALARARALRMGGAVRFGEVVEEEGVPAACGAEAPAACGEGEADADPEMEADEEPEERGALPPGHPVSWEVLTRCTCLEGEAYPYPVFP